MNELRINVNDGVLIATANNDCDYPGIYVFYETDKGDIIDLISAEVKREENNKDIDVYIYEDVTSGDYTGKFTLKHSDITKALYGN